MTLSKRIVVTAADHRFFRTLLQMLRQAERHALHRAHTFVAFDLGLTSAERQAIVVRFPWCEVRTFRFDRYPPHVSHLTIFAWKPLVVSDVALNCDGAVLWLDSGTLFRGSRSLEPIFDRIAARGVFALAGQTAFARCCDSRTLERLRVPPADRRKPYRAGGVLGFDCRREDVRSIIRAWRDAALIPEVIAPAGFDRRTHKFDQAIMTALLYRAEREGAIALGDEQIDISSVNPVPWISTRNKVAPWVPFALDPAVRAYYAVTKTADRWVLRVRGR